MIAWTIFYNPILLPAHHWKTLILILPLSLSVALAYKTVRTKNLRRLPLEVLWAMGYILAGLVALGLGLWILQAIAT